jgi:hypothetical protein
MRTSLAVRAPARQDRYLKFRQGAFKASPLQKGQAIRITPEGKVDVFSTMQGNPAHIVEMEKRAQPITRAGAFGLGKTGS